MGTTTAERQVSTTTAAQACDGSSSPLFAPSASANSLGLSKREGGNHGNSTEQTGGERLPPCPRPPPSRDPWPSPPWSSPSHFSSPRFPTASRDSLIFPQLHTLPFPSSLRSPVSPLLPHVLPPLLPSALHAPQSRSPVLARPLAYTLSGRAMRKARQGAGMMARSRRRRGARGAGILQLSDAVATTDHEHLGVSPEWQPMSRRVAWTSGPGWLQATASQLASRLLA